MIFTRYVALSTALIVTNIYALSVKEELMQGEHSYNKYCSACHQVNGEGEVLNSPPLRHGLAYSSYITTKAAAQVHIDLVLNGVPNTTMASFASLSNEEIANIITYERNAWGNNTKDVVTAQDIQNRRNKVKADSLKDETYAELMRAGQANYQLYCARCHQPDGSGKAPHGPALINSFVARNKDLIDYKIDEVLSGEPGTRMRGYAAQLNNQEIAGIVTYIANAWGNNGNQIIQPKRVQAQRIKLQTKTKENDATYNLKQLMVMGERDYRAYCARCHLTTGLGGAQPGVPALKDSKLIKKEPLQKHIDIILTGVPGGIMRTFAPRLTNLEMASIITYERNAWGNNTGDAVQPTQIQPERERLKSVIEYQTQHQIMQQFINDQKKAKP